MGGGCTGGPSTHDWLQTAPREAQHSGSTTLNFILRLEAESVELQQTFHFLEFDFMHLIFQIYTFQFWNLGTGSFKSQPQTRL